MDDLKFDNLTRHFASVTTRRQALGSFVGATFSVITARRTGSVAGKKRRRRKQRDKALAFNAFGCVDIGKPCRGNDANCCSGICQGKKPKQGKKDNSRCIAHNVLGCPDGADGCVETVPCGAIGSCFQTTGKASYCALTGNCAACTRDADCEPDFGPGAACIVCNSCDGKTACFAAAT
jgi:hypothetical protein